MSVAVTRRTEVEQRDHAVTVLDALGLDTPDRILCSRDPAVLAARAQLVDLVPADFAGVSRLFLPVAPSMPSGGIGRFGAYLSTLDQGATISSRMLDGASYALKVVLRGEVSFASHSLTAGDWMWIPSSQPYEVEVGASGASMFTAIPCAEFEGTTDSSRVAFRHLDRVDDIVTRWAAGDFVTSRDTGIADAVSTLPQIDAIAEAGDGVTHTFLPFWPKMPVVPNADGRFFAWISKLEAGVDIPRHTHTLEMLADFKVVIEGRISCKDRELTTGDWLWAPTGTTYSFKAGEEGALLLSGWPWN